MNILDNVNSFLAANPTAKVWIEEALFRGKSSDKKWGEVSGAHFVIGVETTGIDGKPERRLIGPLPAAAIPSDAANVADMAALLGVVAIQQQQAIEALQAGVVDRDKAIADREATITDCQKTIAEQLATIDADSHRLDMAAASLALTEAALDGKSAELIALGFEVTEQAKTIESLKAQLAATAPAPQTDATPSPTKE